MLTELDDETLGRVVGAVNEICGAKSGGIDQENLLMLTCLQLSYNLDKISEILKPVDKRLNDIKPRCMQTKKECND
jgi:hypothetical protein